MYGRFERDMARHPDRAVERAVQEPYRIGLVGLRQLIAVQYRPCHLRVLAYRVCVVEWWR